MIGILLIAGQIISAALPLTPAQAAAVLARLDSITNRTNVFVCIDCDGPRVTVIRSSPTAGPFGEFPPLPRLRPLNCCSVYVTRLPRRGAHVRKGVRDHRAGRIPSILELRE